MTVTDELLRNAETYAETFDKGDLPLPPARRSRSLACMDARLDPSRPARASSEGDAHVIRNAGGVVTDDEIRSLAISQRLLGTEEIILIHHTDCGMLTFTDDEFKRRDPRTTPASSRHWSAEAFTDLDADVRAVDRPDPGQPVHPEEGLGARLRLRRQGRHAARGDLTEGGRAARRGRGGGTLLRRSGATLARARVGTAGCNPMEARRMVAGTLRRRLGGSLAAIALVAGVAGGIATGLVAGRSGPHGHRRRAIRRRHSRPRRHGLGSRTHRGAG